MELRDVWLQVTEQIEMQMGPVIPGDPGYD
jgi:hypothetical protein